jgi:hypothetical protein
MRVSRSLLIFSQFLKNGGEVYIFKGGKLLGKAKRGGISR